MDVFQGDKSFMCGRFQSGDRGLVEHVKKIEHRLLDELF